MKIVSTLSAGQEFGAAEIAGLGLSFMAVVLTVVTVVATAVVVFLGIRYSSHLKEIEDERKSLAESNRLLQEAVKRNEAQAQQSLIGFEITFAGQISQRILHKLERVEGQYKNSAAFQKQIEKAQSELEARYIELEILIGGPDQNRTNLRYLCEKIGDRYTLQYVEKMISLYKLTEKDLEDLYDAKAILKSRLNISS